MYLLKHLGWPLNSLRPSDSYMCQETNHHWFRQWLAAWLAPSHCLNQWWNIFNWTLRNKLHLNLNRNSHILIQGNAFKMSSGKWWPFCLDLNVFRVHSSFWFIHDLYIIKFRFIFFSKKGFRVRSFGSGTHVKLPGSSPDKPNIYDFNTTYDEMYKDLMAKDRNLYPWLMFKLNFNPLHAELC